MKTVKEWVSGLHVPKEKYELWLSEAPAGESFTYWCLQSGRLNEEEYLSWARGHYCLPSLNTKFFDQPANRELWTRIQSVANWSTTMIPIAEWDGLVYVACVEPDLEHKWSFPVRYVLAKAKSLKKLWQELITSDEISFAGFPPTPDKQSTNVTKTTPVAVATAPVLAATPFAIAPAVGVPPAPAVIVPPPPAVVIPPPPAVTAAPAIAASDSLPSDIPPALPVDEPAGLNLSAFKMESASKERDFMGELSSQVKGEETPSSPAAFDDDATVAPEGFFTSAPKPAPDEGSLILTSIDIAAPDASGDSTPSFVTDSVPAPSVVLSPVSAPAISQPSPISAAPQAAAEPSPKTVPLSYTQFLSQMVANFSGAMIIDVARDNFTPVVWNESFHPQAGAQRVWNLNPPSAFRIAYRTGQPYLGHVVETPANTEFFKAWGFEAMPKNILVQPVKTSGDKVTHLLLCLTDTLKKNHQLLSEAERLANDFAMVLTGQKAA